VAYALDGVLMDPGPACTFVAMEDDDPTDAVLLLPAGEVESRDSMSREISSLAVGLGPACRTASPLTDLVDVAPVPPPESPENTNPFDGLRP
jgi:hypothetical protein